MVNWSKHASTPEKATSTSSQKELHRTLYLLVSAIFQRHASHQTNCHRSGRNGLDSQNWYKCSKCFWQCFVKKKREWKQHKCLFFAGAYKARIYRACDSHMHILVFQWQALSTYHHALCRWQKNDLKTRVCKKKLQLAEYYYVRLFNRRGIKIEMTVANPLSVHFSCCYYNSVMLLS